MQGNFCGSCGTMLAKKFDEAGNVVKSCSNNNCTSQKNDKDQHNVDARWQIFQYICLQPHAGINQIKRYTNHSHETVQLEITALEEKNLIGYQLGKRKAHEYFPLMPENDLHRYKLILEKPMTLEDIAKATGSVANDERMRLGELEARGILCSKTLDEFGTKRYYAVGRNYSLQLRKD